MNEKREVLPIRFESVTDLGGNSGGRIDVTGLIYRRQLSSNDDLNNIRQSGIYDFAMDNSPANIPDNDLRTMYDLNAFIYVVDYMGTASYQELHVYERSDSRVKTYTRLYIGDKWTPWISIEDIIEELKNYVSDGKLLVANAITDKGVTTAADASFQVMAQNIENIDSDVTLQEKSATLDINKTSISLTPDENFDGLSKATVSITTQEKTAPFSTKAQTITPDNGKVLSKVKTSAVSDYSSTTQDAMLTNDSEYTYAAIPANGYYNKESKLRFLKDSTDMPITIDINLYMQAGVHGSALYVNGYSELNLTLDESLSNNYSLSENSFRLNMGDGKESSRANGSFSFSITKKNN